MPRFRSIEPASTEIYASRPTGGGDQGGVTLVLISLEELGQPAAK